MDETNYMLKCRALFLYNISQMSKSEIYLDENLNGLLLDFFRTYGCEYFELFELILCFDEVKDNTDEYEIYEDEEWISKLYSYLRVLCFNNYNEVTKIYEEIGNANVSKICELAELFYKYLEEIVEENSLIKIRH